ncbi:MAG TPA: NUDIX domain-containing protein [Streptosporangiaceae bacterium]
MPPELSFDLERSAVRAVVQDRGGRVLLFRAFLDSRSDQVWWELPGGGIEPGETHLDAVIRELREETGLEVTPGQVSEVRWRRSATWLGRGIRRLQHEVVVGVRIDADRPEITDGGRTVQELEEYSGAEWWTPEQIMASTERFYPGRLPVLLPGFLAGQFTDEPFERWN